MHAPWTLHQDQATLTAVSRHNRPVGWSARAIGLESAILLMIDVEETDLQISEKAL
jgi:hypothetical protein